MALTPIKQSGRALLSAAPLRGFGFADAIGYHIGFLFLGIPPPSPEMNNKRLYTKQQQQKSKCFRFRWVLDDG
jgi:hypothetical protein